MIFLANRNGKGTFAMSKEKELNEDIKIIASFYGVLNQLDKTIEECSELILETSKIKQYLREHNFDTDWSWREHIIEEMADVLVMIKQLIYIFSCKKEVKSMMEYKVKRQRKRIQEKCNQNNIFEFEIEVDKK